MGELSLLEYDSLSYLISCDLYKLIEHTIPTGYYHFKRNVSINIYIYIYNFNFLRFFIREKTYKEYNNNIYDNIYTYPYKNIHTQIKYLI